MDECSWMKKNKMDEKTNQGKNDRSPSGYQQGIDFLKTNTLPIGYLHDI